MCPVRSVTYLSINDGVSRMPIGDGFVANASKQEVNAALAAVFMEPDFYAGPYNPIVINTGSKLVLVDTGIYIACPRVIYRTTYRPTMRLRATWGRDEIQR